ncbi:MAG: transglutaminase family protein [Pseudomonadota bacterium]
MRLTVEHVTHYRFDPPRTRVVQSHRLTPAVTEGQRPEAWAIEAEGAVRGAAFTDGAGDRITSMTLSGPVAEVALTVAGTVVTMDTAGVLRGHREMVAPSVYLRKTRQTAPGVAIVDLAKRLPSAADLTLDAAHTMANHVAEAIEYTPGATHTEMTATEAVELGRGVCQDHAQVLIALARWRGMPARYVTGYLFADADGQAHEASHAWAELFVPDLGWVGFDPANGCCPDERYIRLGSGFDALDAAPIRGISLGAGDESMDISVNVAAQQ